jgi:bifunctional non-homologous end joining protein LigD
LAAAALDRYRARRDFARTPEPAGGTAQGTGRLFVVHKHAARRLHYDLRLELGVALKSWAVTRGPSLDPKDRRLAVHVEDHPLDYAAFEGVIPKGQYGGGTVMAWDKGAWRPEGDPEAGYAAGRLTFRLEGKKLRGGWTLVRMGRGKRARDERQEPWLLIKERDPFAREGDSGFPDDDRSVLSGRSMAEIAAGAPAADPRTPPPAFVKPQLASLAAGAPAGDGWLHELKHDGYRCQLRVEAGSVVVRTRGGHDWTHRFARVAEAAAALPVASALIDGEAVALDEHGVSRFGLLRRALEAGDGAAVSFYAFDLLHLDGEDLRGLPLRERKRRLEALLPRPGEGAVRYSDHVLGRGAELWEAACRLGAEGLVAKRADAPYRSGRTTSWLKVKCTARQEVVVGGFMPVRGRRTGLGALPVGTYEGDPRRLAFAGKVGTGWGEEEAERILAALEPLRQAEPPFAAVPALARRGARWVAPRLVAEVRFQEWTPDGRLRHARWIGFREDRPATTVRRERFPPAPPTASAPRIGSVRLTHPDRVVLADPPRSKADLWRYYAAVADRLLEELAGRPLSVVRCPSGAEGACFYQRHRTEGMPPAIRPAPISGGKARKDYFAIEDAEGLLALVQFGAVELHPWGARADRPDRPDRLVFDLDPAEGLPWSRVVDAAHELRERLRALRLESFARTTGGKGLHLVVPIERRHGWPAAKAFAAGLARAMAKDSPARYTANLAKAGRRGWVFVDYLRNEHGATAVASYSVRARPGAPVATPVGWEQVTAGLDPRRFTIDWVPELARARADPWAGMRVLRQRLPRA